MSQLTRNSLIALLITITLIGTVVYAINYLNSQRIAQLNEIQERITTDTLSVETQFALLEEAPCEDLTQGSTLSKEVNNLGEHLSFTENKLGITNPQVIELRKQYALLQIRDFLLTKKLMQSCGIRPTVALYFYSNTPGSCSECDRASYALSYIHSLAPSLRVYSFDYNLDLGALKTLIAIEKVEKKFPAFVINNKNLYGFDTVDEFKKNFPKDIFATTSTTNTNEVKLKN